MNTTGKFIAFEGGEGTGKSTQARLLMEALERRGIRCVLTREPGGTQGAEAIRDLLLAPPYDHRRGEGWGAQAEALLFAAARADHVVRLIRPAIAEGNWVICDRFVDSSRAYQGMAGDLGDESVRALHRIGSGGLLPDLTVLLGATDERVAERLRMRDGNDADAIGGRSVAYHARVNRAFQDLAAAEPERFAVINGDGTIAEVHGRVMAALAPLLC